MKRYSNSSTARHFLLVGLLAGFALPLPALAASVSLATQPLATSTTSTVQPNILLVIDNSISMEWDHMPDEDADPGSKVTFRFGYYGLRSSQCNMVYYDPTFTYQTPVDAAGNPFADSSFTAAHTNGFSTASSTVNLNTSFQAPNDSSGQSAYYYVYTGTQTTQLQKDYHSTTNTFYGECSGAKDAAPGNAVFSKRRLSTTETTTITISAASSAVIDSITVNGVELMNGDSAGGGTSTSTTAANIAAKIALNGFTASASTNVITVTGPTSAADYTPVIHVKGGSMTYTAEVFPDTTPAHLTNFANWYSFYRTRILMMKTATGRAFGSLTNKYRVGLAKFSATSPVLNVGTFEGTATTEQRGAWYKALYDLVMSGSTPTRTALSNAGRYYAHKLGVADPVQYSCQQNFTILSSDGYWNDGEGSKLDGSAFTDTDNPDGAAEPPMWDGAVLTSTWTNVYTRTRYLSTGTKISALGGSNCSSSRRRGIAQPQVCSCTVTVAGAQCASACLDSSTLGWANTGTASYLSPFTSNSTTCTSSTISLPSPNPTPRQLQSSVQTTSGGYTKTLADVAMYYYQTDLRSSTWSNCPGADTTVDVCKNNVFTSSTDTNTQQHMTTFTLGLGASGWMKYSSSYLSDTAGSTADPCDSAPDFVAIKLRCPVNLGVTPPVCSWQTTPGACVWPEANMDTSTTPSSGYIGNVDDLWHAAVNGHGAYFSATNPATLSSGLSNALAGLKSREGSAAAAATSTLNPVAGDNFAYVASYTTVKWKGNLEARGINVDTGVVSENATWCVENVTAGICAAPSSVQYDASGSTSAAYCVTPDSPLVCAGGTILNGTECWVPVTTACPGTMSALVSDVSDTRTIYTANSTGTALIPFDTNYRAANPGYFDAAHIGTLSQWSTLTAAQQTAAAGDNLINFLRGQHGYEDRTANAVENRLYRYREAVMGDALESQPTFIAAPVFSYPYPGYAEFKAAHSAPTPRGGTVYIGANDGMLHAFNADTGVERWAYVPSMVIPNMWKLADRDYANLHTNFVNGSPATSDVCVAYCTDAANAIWKTILVAGLGGGGRGYYALDITNPAAPSLLWEFTPQSGIGAVKDDDVGYGFGQPIITRKVDGTWVVLVASGYNNTSGSGTGGGYLFVLNPVTGDKIAKIATGEGDPTTPSGLAKIAAYNGEPGGNLATHVYGGDLQGNLWRFNINVLEPAAYGTGSVIRFAQLYSDAAGTLPQPIMTTPVLAKILGKRIVIVGTGKYLETSDLTTTQVQSYYSIKDDDADAPLVNPRNTLVQQTLVEDAATASRSSTGSSPNWSTGRGCYADFPDTGERENIDSKLVQGIVLVPTIVPSNTACSPGGYGWLNYFDYKTCSATSVKSDATIVGVNVVYVQGTPVVSWVTDRDPTPHQPPQQPEFYPPVSGFSGRHVIWRELIPN